MIYNTLISAAAEVDIGSVMNSSLTFQERISLGIQTMLLGMGIVFAVLIIIMGVLQLFRIFFYDLPNKSKKAQNAVVETPAAEQIASDIAPESAEENDDEAVMAAISAAVAVYLDAPAVSFRVVSFKRVNKK